MNDIKYNETAIVICSYKNRTDILFKYLNDIKDFDIYIVVRTNDYTESGYDKYVFNDNIKFLKSDNLHNVTDTRWFGHQEVIKMGYRGMIMIDDDINGKYAYYITPESKRTTSNSYRQLKTSIENLCKILIDKANEYDAAAASPIYGNLLGFKTPNKVNVNTGLNCGGFVFHNLDYDRQYGITFDIKNPIIHEDLDIFIQYLLKGLNCITLEYFCVSTNMNMDLSVASDKEIAYNAHIFTTYVKYRDYVDVVIKKSGVFGVSPKWKRMVEGYQKGIGEQFIIDNDYRNTLYDLCKQYISTDIKEQKLDIEQQIRSLIKNTNGNEKNRTKQRK